MNQYLIAFCYLFTIALLFLAFFIVRAVHSSSPFNIDLYRDNTIISFAIYNPAELQYRFGPPQEKVREHDWNTNWNAQDDVNNNWDDHESQVNNDKDWNHTDDWTAGLGNQPQLNMPEWIDWVFAYISLDQIREIAGRLFAQNFRTNYKAEHGIPFRVVTPEPDISQLEEESVEEAQDQWEIGSNDEIPGFGNFEENSHS
jgi:hypothetical protein